MSRATPTLTTIRSRMMKSRKYALENAIDWHNTRLMKFCKDDAAFNWACRYYRYQSDAFHGNVPDIDESSFKDMFWIVTDTENFRYASSQLKEDLRWGDKETKYLLDTLVALRKKYKS